MKTPFGEIHEGELKVYQNGERIEAYWKIDEHNRVSFEIPNYNPDLAMTIDPLTRVWGTYYGGGGSDAAYSVKIDELGNILMAGGTEATSNIASGGHQNIFGGGLNDAFLVKFNSSGMRQWATYYGGSGGWNFEEAVSVAVDASNDIYITGTTSSTLSIASVGHQNMNGGGNDAYLAKFNSAGVRLWATYYGGTGGERGRGVAVDNLQNVYLTGSTSSVSSIAAGGHQNILGGSGDAFVVKFNSAGVRLWATYYGGTGNDGAKNICWQ
jgi:hypothetical protein